MNRSAAVVAGLIGVVLIAGTFPFTLALWPDAPTQDARFLVGWDAVAADGTAGLSLAGTPDSGEAVLDLNSSLPADLIVQIACTDQDLQGQAPATITITLYEGDEELDTTSGTCAALGDSWTVHYADAPSIVGLDAQDKDAAESLLAENVTAGDHTFRLAVSTSRASAGPLALPGTNLQVDLELTATEWHGSVIENTPEAVK